MNEEGTIEVTILEDGLHAKEANPYGFERPKKFIGESSPAQHGVRVRQWEEAEFSLRTFQIEKMAASKAYAVLPRDEKFKAKILPNDKIMIL